MPDHGGDTKHAFIKLNDALAHPSTGPLDHASARAGLTCGALLLSCSMSIFERRSSSVSPLSPCYERGNQAKTAARRKRQPAA